MDEFMVDGGNESWDYDMPDGMPPILIIDDYFVKIGGHVVKRFSNKDSANDFAKIMNEALDKANKLIKMEISKEIHEILIDENISIGKANRINEKLSSLFNDRNKAYQDKLIKLADEWKESAKVWHSNEVYIAGIDCALDLMKKHIKKIANNG